tara:strand:+ start:547 stop:699 length:153 start_codon:yes stop_codon:yes gene_type:complete
VKIGFKMSKISLKFEKPDMLKAKKYKKSQFLLVPVFIKSVAQKPRAEIQN